MLVIKNGRQLELYLYGFIVYCFQRLDSRIILIAFRIVSKPGDE